MADQDLDANNAQVGRLRFERNVLQTTLDRFLQTESQASTIDADAKSARQFNSDAYRRGAVDVMGWPA